MELSVIIGSLITLPIFIHCNCYHITRSSYEITVIKPGRKGNSGVDAPTLAITTFTIGFRLERLKGFMFI